MDIFDLTGQSIVVTGSTKGIGRGIVECMAKAGANLIVSSRTQADASAVADELNSAYGAGKTIAHGIACDIESDEDMENLIGEAIKLYGKIDTLVCNAAILPVIGPSAQTSRKDFERIVAGNNYQAFRLAHLAFNDMKKRKNGSIIFIGSSAGSSVALATMAYAVAKAGLSHLARNLAAEFAPSNVRVNCLAPGLIRSFSSEPVWKNENVLKGMTAGIPLQRIGEPEEVAAAALYLASRGGAFTTGTTMWVDGGSAFLEVSESNLEDIYSPDHKFN